MNQTATTQKLLPSTRAALGFRFSSSVLIWLALVGYLVLAKLVLGLLPPLNVREVASIFSWSSIAVYAALGLVGVWLASHNRFPAGLDRHISNRERIWLPLLLGLALAIIAVLIDRVTGGTHFIETQTGQASFNVYFPASMLVYTAGVVEVNAFYLLFPLPLLLWLISSIILRGRYKSPVFWVLAVLLSLGEPALQGLGILFLKTSSGTPWLFLTVFLPYFLTDYPLNLGQAIFFRRYGLLAPVALRLGFYLMWHVVYGSLLYPALR